MIKVDKSNLDINILSIVINIEMVRERGGRGGER